MNRQVRERRHRVADAIRAGQSQRAIARAEGVDHATIRRDIAWLQCHGEHLDVAGPPAPDRGNQRATTHGATSEVLLAPLREKHADELLRSYPWLDARRLAILADRLARVEQAGAWLAAQGTVVRNEHGQVYDVADRIEKWGAKAEQIIADLEDEARERAKAAAGRGLEAVVAEIAAGGTDTPPPPDPQEEPEP